MLFAVEIKIAHCAESFGSDHIIPTEIFPFGIK
jgi:hypothetical protein